MDFSNPETKAFFQKQMQAMQRLSQEHPDVLQDALRQQVDQGQLTNSNYHGDKKKLIQQHQKNYKEYLKSLNTSYVTMNMGVPDDYISKKTVDSSRYKKKKVALPIPIKKLHIGTTHHGRILKGILIENPIVMRGASTLLQDQAGDVVKVSFYPDEILQIPNSDMVSKWRLGHQIFPKGLHVEIFEPFFKVAMDNTYVVRVDNMVDVNTNGSLQEPSTPLKFNTEGKKYVAASHYDEAALCYTNGIKHITSSQPLYMNLFQNLALVHLNLNQFETALHYATGAILLNPDTAVKAYFRAALALDNLKSYSLALHCCKMVERQNGNACNDPLFKALYKRMISKGSSLGGVMWKSDQMIEFLSKDPDICIERRNETQDPTELKKSGNECVDEGRYYDAKVWYEIALSELERRQEISMATFLSNTSFCMFKIGDYHISMLNATVALLLEPRHKKAHYRRISSLLNLERIENAKRCFDYGRLTLQNESKCLDSLEQRIIPSTKSQPKYQQKEEYKSEHVPFQMVGMMNTMLEMSGIKENLLHDIPAFNLKYPQSRGWPKQCDPVKCRALLDEAFELGRSDMLLFMLKNNPKEVLLGEDYIMKRLGTNCKSRMEWLIAADVGNVCFRERSCYGGGSVHHSYGNVAQKPQIMRRGTTHVAVGFADLQELLICQLKDPPIPSTSLSENGKLRQPLNWIGYDQSPYVVAKTIILIEMMKDTNIPAQSVVQVWYAAAWSQRTLCDFRKVLARVYNSNTDVSAFVRDYWTYWQRHDVSLGQSREDWMKNHDSSPWSDEICNWKRDEDMLAICTYAMTGQLCYPDLSAGSIVMFALPHGESVAKNEDVFQVVNLKDFLKFYERQDNVDGCLEVLTMYLESKVQVLMDRIQGGEIIIEVFCDEIQIDHKVLIDTIHYHHQPSSMSWSNLCDYINPRDFHKMLHQCSIGSGTAHFGYSMNWSMEVKGTYLGDYAFVYDDEFLKKFVEKTYDEAIKSIRKVNSSFHKYVTFRPKTNPYNIIDWELCKKRNLHNVWFQAFIAEAPKHLTKESYNLDLDPTFQFNARANSITTFNIVL